MSIGAPRSPAGGAAPIADRGRAETGARIPGGLTLERRIGEGALGEVWRARWEGHDEPVAVKLLSPTGSVMAGDDLHRRFAVEARAAQSVEHPNAVRVLSQGNTEDGVPFVVMELLEGETLSNWLARDGVIGIRHVAQMIDEIGAALDAVHAAKLIHRDVKPHNIFVAEGPSFKLIDFGSAKHLDELAAASVPGRRTDPDIVVGTPAYLSPEMVTEPSGADHRADLWALGVTAFKCLTGHLPFAGESLVDVCTNIMAGRLRRPTKLLPTLPAGLDLWFSYVFGADIDTRPASGAAMARSFREAIDDAARTRVLPRRPAPRPRWPLVLGASLPGVAIGAAATLWLVAPEPGTAVAGLARLSVEIPPPPPAVEATAPPPYAPPPPPLAPAPLLQTLARNRVVVAGDPPCADDDAACADAAAVPTFAIDRFEVTVMAYARCVQAGACSDEGLRGVAETPPVEGGRCNWGFSQRLQHPINCVSYDQAEAYCRWVGARLPRGDEWEKAARGREGRAFPWGDAPASCRVAVMRDGPAGCRAEGTWPVGSKIAGVSPFGAYDMSGNVREWVDAWYDDEQAQRVTRGGAWDATDGEGLLATRRDPMTPAMRAPTVGFRCADDGPRDAEATAAAENASEDEAAPGAGGAGETGETL